MTSFLVEVVRDAGKLTGKKPKVHTNKGGGDIATDIDVLVERFIIKRLMREYPDVPIVSEELNPSDELPDTCFVIDPIDGTGNFYRGIPLWGIQVAYVEGGKTKSAVIYLPPFGEMFYANEKGAFLNGRKIRVSDTPLDKAIYDIEGHYKVKAYDRMLKCSRHMRNICCSAVLFAWVAKGRIDGVILRKDSIWDYLPGQFLVQQAGGQIRNACGGHVAANSAELADVLMRDACLTVDDQPSAAKVLAEALDQIPNECCENKLS